jgi:predicted MFS family arabinose efflux permease
MLAGGVQVGALLLSTLVVGVAGAFELTARNKYCALLVDHPDQLASYLTSFSVVFNVGKLVGPPIGGWLVALFGPAAALAIDAASYLLPIASVIWLLQPARARERRSGRGAGGSLMAAWRGCGPDLRHVLRFTALICLVGFFHPGLAPYIASRVLGPSPQDLGLFTSVLAAGSISGGLVLQRQSHRFCGRPMLTLAGFALVTALGQIGMPLTSGRLPHLLMTFLIGAGTAGLIASSNLITQVGSDQVLRGRMGGLNQIAVLGGGGVSGLAAAALVSGVGLAATFAIAGAIGAGLAGWEMLRRGRVRLRLRSA